MAGALACGFESGSTENLRNEKGLTCLASNISVPGNVATVSPKRVESKSRDLLA
jgi:hypothetical protein